MWELLGMLLTVVAVLALAYLCTRYLAGRMPGLAGAGRGKGGMRVLDQLTLGRDQRLTLVQVGEQFLLLGVTPNGITQLTQLTAEETAQWTSQPQTQEGDQARKSFRDAFMRSLTRDGRQGGTGVDRRIDQHKR